MNIEKYFNHIVALTLLILAGVYHSPLFGYASVGAMLGIMAHSIMSAKVALTTVKPGIPEELKRQIQDLNARIATLEYGVKTRGF